MNRVGLYNYIYMFYNYVYMYSCMYVCTYVCMCVCMHACMHACMHVCIYTGTQHNYITYTCMCVCLSKSICVHDLMHIHVCTCIYIHRSMDSWVLGFFQSRARLNSSFADRRLGNETRVPNLSNRLTQFGHLRPHDLKRNPSTPSQPNPPNRTTSVKGP